MAWKEGERMISAWHLLWIVPLAIYIGLAIGGMLAAAKDER